MAVVNLKSTIVTGLDVDPGPKTKELSHLIEGSVREQAGIASVAAGDDDTSVYRLFRVRSSVRIVSLKILHALITAGTDYDLGVYRTLKDGGAVVDQDILAATLDLSSARDVMTEVLGVPAADLEKPLWELVGLTEDPNLQYDICITAPTVGSSTVSIAARMGYVQ